MTLMISVHPSVGPPRSACNACFTLKRFVKKQTTCGKHTFWIYPTSKKEEETKHDFNHGISRTDKQTHSL